MNEVLDLLESRRDQHIREVAELVAIPSVSAKPERAPDLHRAAEWIAARLRSLGMERVEVFPTPGYPIVYAEWMKSDGPTVLVYGHYDVMPEEPVELWNTPPFEATVKGHELYGRGTVDDKGQVFIHIAVLRAFLDKRGKLPVNIKFLVEGEEESGSNTLDTFVNSHVELLRADAVLISDTGMLKKGLPGITHALRGLAYFQLEIQGPERDLHSGSFGGAVPNPCNVLCDIIAKLKDADGRVAVPGFYDDVVPLRPEERRALAELPFDEQEFQRTTGSPRLAGEKGYTTLERIWARPTLDVNGLWGGYQGEGAKTVLPAKAGAKFSTRLVANQDPDKIAALVETYAKSLAPAGVKIEFQQLGGGGKPFLAPFDHPYVQAAKRALEAGFGTPAVFIREGGSIPFVANISAILGVPCILMGFGLPDENSHAPNEHIDLDNFFGGIRSVAYYLDELAKVGKVKR